MNDSRPIKTTKIDDMDLQFYFAPVAEWVHLFLIRPKRHRTGCKLSGKW
jgi:hypothetical protein